jgi:hypothetical protein
MYRHNKRLTLPKSVEFDNKCVEVVNEFKLLGVTIDNNLNFDAFVAQQCSSINQRLYIIKRQYYLPEKVKTTFFKAFILLCFDYCISLSIYFSKYNLQRLCKIYYYCIHTLFKIDLSSLSIHTIQALLEPYGIDSFVHRVISRIIVFYIKMSANE